MPYDEDDSEQALAPTKVCVKWGCAKAPLVKIGKYWCCPKCNSSYGENPHPELK